MQNKYAINYKELYSINNCEINEGRCVKSLYDCWLNVYYQLIVIDDSTEIWDANSKENCQMLVPEKFTVFTDDDELKKVISSSLKIISD